MNTKDTKITAMENKLAKVKRVAITLSVIGILILITIISSITIVPPGHTGVVVHLGNVSDSILNEGVHLKAPFITQVVDVSNKVQLLEADAGAVSKDLQSVRSKVAINYRLVSDFSASMYQNVGLDYETILIAPAAQESIKAATARYTAENLIGQRDVVGDEIKTSLESKLNSYGIYIEKFSIVNFDFSEEYDNAIELKQIAEQDKLRAETEKARRTVEAEAAAAEKTIAAQAEAEAILAKADAQAEANKKISESIDQNVLYFNQIERWDGIMPKVVGEGSGFIFNIEDSISKEVITEK
jgi:regulator of protease activity HflC (stomatin/prohibitin superfamily)